ncbi:MAG TPA: DUF4159 domain-containing protein, partial [Tepidisphaeraceae bacterium]|nr:DUF4159 domain-containing protein [Tepidisphaeraceae bacterium]
MALVRCPGCGQVFEFNGSRVSCPSCGTVMRIAPPPPGMVGEAGPVDGEVETLVIPQSPAPLRVTPVGEPWLSDTAKMWIGIVVGVLMFALVLDWFRMKITPAKKVVDETKVEQLAHDMADSEIARLKAQVEKLEAQVPKPPETPVAVQAPPAAVTTTQVKPEGNWQAALNDLAHRQGITTAPAATSTTARNEAFASLMALKPERPKDGADAVLTDAQINASIKKGLDWFINHFAKHRLANAEAYDAGMFPGVDAISVYALLTAGQAIKDERVRPSTTLVKDLLDGLKEMPMEGSYETYSRSLRISALGVLDRREDRATIDNDAHLLLESCKQGAFDYMHPQPGQTRANSRWDNSNSQYGGLGIWAASEAGYRPPNQFWKDVESHWTDAQVKLTGGWAYQGNTGPAILSMTCAGATMLMLSRDQVTVEGTSPNTTAPLSRALERGLEWLDEGEHVVEVKGAGHPGYTLYGLERVGLATGYKFFGKHDWYKELAKWAVETQQKDGSWVNGDTVPSETAFHLLFLARGREPVFMGKLRWDGNWTNRPRDVALLTRFAGKALEQTFNWQVLGTQRDWMEWTDAPVMLITSDEAPKLTDEDVAKLRSYALAGGLIFTHAEGGSAAFNAFAADLAKRMFPEYEMKTLPATHGIYSALVPIAGTVPVLAGVSNGSRLLMVHSPTDLTKQWGVRINPGEKDRARTMASDMGVNVVVWATGKQDLRRRTDSAYVAERTEKPVGKIPVARLKYEGNWDPEPWGWVREARLFDRATSIGLDVKGVDLVALEPKTAPVAFLTGTAAHQFTDAEVKVVKEYVEGGGMLLIDSCGGGEAFAESVRTNLLG